MRKYFLILVLLSGAAQADDNEIFLETCSFLQDITTVDLCENVGTPFIEDRVGWRNLGSYDYKNATVILKQGLQTETRSRVLAHEIAHHILHISGVVIFKPDNKQLWCVSEVYAYEVTRMYAEAHNQIRSPGEITWIPRYPHCIDVL